MSWFAGCQSRCTGLYVQLCNLIWACGSPLELIRYPFRAVHACSTGTCVYTVLEFVMYVAAICLGFASIGAALRGVLHENPSICVHFDTNVSTVLSSLSAASDAAFG